MLINFLSFDVRKGKRWCQQVATFLFLPLLGGGTILPEIQTRACERGAYGRLSVVEFEVIPHTLLTTCEWFTIVTASKIHIWRLKSSKCAPKLFEKVAG